MPIPSSKFNPSAGLGAILIVVLLAAVGILVFLFISNTFDFKDRLFNQLFPKPLSKAAQEQARSVPDEILLKFKKDIPDNAKENIRNSHGLKVEDVIEQIGVERVTVPEQAKDAVIEALNKNPQIEYAEPNYIAKALSTTPNDSKYPQQWHIPQISIPSAWDLSKGKTSTGASIIVADIDTGVDANHEDIVGKVTPGYNFIGNNTNITDDHGHGTAVAGVMGASTNNSLGVAGLGWDTKIMPVKVIDSNGGSTYSLIANGIMWAADNGAQVINLSLGGSADSQTLKNAVIYAFSTKNVTLVAAAGGSSSEVTTVLFPAAYDEYVIAVGSVDSSGKKTNYSNTGSQLDVMAPSGPSGTSWAGGILTTVPAYLFPESNGYGLFSGTSASAPEVAAVAALVLAANPNLTNQQITEIIEQNTDDIAPDGWDNQTGWGVVNAYKAVLAATGGTPPSPTPTLTPTPTSTPGTSSVVISNISSTTTANSAIVKWTTNVPATSRVSYGTSSTNLNQTTPENTNLTTSHSVTLSGLTKQTRYYFKVHSKNSAGLETSSSINQFRTKNR